MENDFNFDNFFIDMMQNLEKSGQIINDKYLKSLIKNWKIKDFNLDENGVVKNDYAIKELEKTVEKLIVLIPANVMYTIMGVSKKIATNATRDNICGDTLFLCMLCFSIHRYFAKNLQMKNLFLLI